MSVDPAPNTRRRIRPLFVIPIVVASVLTGGYLAADRHDDPAPADDAKVAAASQVTRDSGDSVIRSHDGSGAVNLRSCPGLPAAGQSTGCDIIDRLPDGTVVTMECWIDGGPVPGRADTDRRWFLVTPGAGAPHPGRRGYVFSAEIPVEQQVRKPKCTNDLTNDLLTAPEPPTQPSKTPAPVTPAPPEPSTPVTSPPAPPLKPVPTPTPTFEPPAPLETTVTVYNQVTNGPTQMREDTRNPAYLSTRPVRQCDERKPACNLPGYLATGDRLVALCQTTGDRITNGEDRNPDDDHNPGLDESTLWYRLRAPDGRTGYLSVIWLAGGDRGGLGLPTC